MSDRPGSPPCLAAEIAPDYFDPMATDAAQARDVARWRRAVRESAQAARMALTVAERQALSDRLCATVRAALAARGADRPGHVIAGYWPIKGEPDLRPLLADLATRRVTVALPVVVRRASPLVFRRWSPGAALIRGDWAIPVPAPEVGEVDPDTVLAPVLGWDPAGYRLGWGGGYFDRTLAARKPRPLAIGLGLTQARLPTIYPQPHDIAMDVIVTEDGIGVPSSAEAG